MILFAIIASWLRLFHLKYVKRIPVVNNKRRKLCNFAYWNGYTKFLFIASARGLRDGFLSAVGIPHRRCAARFGTAEVLCQLSVAQQQTLGPLGGIAGCAPAAMLVRSDPYGYRTEEREWITGTWSISLQRLPIVLPFQYLHLLNVNLVEFSNCCEFATNKLGL